MLKILTFIMLIGILGANYYFINNIRWMDIWHYSDKARNMMTDLFVYLGANHYAAFFAHFIFIMFGLFLLDKSNVRKILLLGSISLTIYCLVYTLSRGAYLAFLVGLLFLGLVRDKKILLLLFAFLIVWRSFVPIAVVERVDMTMSEEGELDTSAAIRVELWDVAWDMFKESPLIGQGFNTFRAMGYADTHNLYLKLLAELGIIGLGAFLFLIYSAFRISWRLYKEANDWFLRGLGLGFAACIIAVLITNAFGDRWSYLSLGSYFWIFMGVVTCGYTIIQQEKLKQISDNSKDE